MSHCDASLARFAYTGYTSGDTQPIAANAVQAGGFQATVAGRRYGNGSSRERSPAAEQLAGGRLVIAESFERIYRQNADNIGLFHLDRLLAGHADRSGRADRANDRRRLQQPVADGRRARRFGQRHRAGFTGRADQDRHRIRRLLHRRQAGGLRPLPRGAGLGARQRHARRTGVELFLQYGTTAVRDYCVAQGYSRTFSAVGARILQPSCGACANCGPGSSTSAAQVTVSAINRNFPGRSGPGRVWHASPPTVMASALAGELISFASLKQRAAANP